MASQGRRAALVTGAGSGIGRAIALELGQQGFGVSVVEFTESQGQETVELLQEQNAKSPGLSADFIFTKCDVTKPDQLSGAFERHLKHFGRLDVVVNNAGIGGPELFTDTSADGTGMWRRMVDVNFTAMLDGTRLAVQAMKKLKSKGAIINVASAAGLYPSPNAPVYHGTKGGVVMFTRCLAYLAKEGIRVSALCPEFLDTPMVREQLARKDRILERQLVTLGGFISMEMLMEGFRTLLADEASPGQSMWVTRRFGCQYWPFGKEGAKWQIKNKQPVTGGGAAHGQKMFRKIVVHTLTTDFRAATHIVEAPLPLSIPAGHVLIRYLYAGINASDVNYSAGVYHGSKEVAARNLPMDAGFEAVGLIAAVGEGVGSGKRDAGLAVNAPAATLRYGGFAEYGLVPARQVLPVPSATKEVVAMLTSGLTASLALEQAGQMGTDQTVLVTAAAGGTGQFAVQLAKLAGNRVVATCGGAAKAELLRSLHVDVVIDYTRDDVTATLKRECAGGVDIVYESVGGDMFRTCLNALAPGGKLIVIGMMSQYTADSGQWQRTSVPGLTERLLWKSQTLAGFFLPNYAQHFKRHLAKLAALHAAGMLQVAVDPRPFVGLENVPDAVEYLQSGKSLGKVVVEIAKGPAASSRL